MQGDQLALLFEGLSNLKLFYVNQGFGTSAEKGDNVGHGYPTMQFKLKPFFFCFCSLKFKFNFWAGLRLRFQLNILKLLYNCMIWNFLESRGQ